MIPNYLIVVPGSMGLSVLVLIIAIICAFALLYFGRTPAHKAIKTICYSFRNGMRMASKSVLLAEKWLVHRNKEVLLAMGREGVERTIEREFHRVDAVVKRDLSGYPELQRMIADQIISIEEDYKESAEVQPPAPTWVEAVEAVAILGQPVGLDAPRDAREQVTGQMRNAHPRQDEKTRVVRQVGQVALAR